MRKKQPKTWIDLERKVKKESQKDVLAAFRVAKGIDVVKYVTVQSNINLPDHIFDYLMEQTKR